MRTQPQLPQLQRGENPLSATERRHSIVALAKIIYVQFANKSLQNLKIQNEKHRILRYIIAAGDKKFVVMDDDVFLEESSRSWDKIRD